MRTICFCFLFYFFKFLVLFALLPLPDILLCLCCSPSFSSLERCWPSLLFCNESLRLFWISSFSLSDESLCYWNPFNIFVLMTMYVLSHAPERSAKYASEPYCFKKTASLKQGKRPSDSQMRAHARAFLACLFPALPAYLVDRCPLHNLLPTCRPDRASTTASSKFWVDSFMQLLSVKSVGRASQNQ